MKHGSLFSGVGGFDLASEWMGWENLFHCEWNEFGKKVLKYYWPNAISYDDITKTDFTVHRGEIDILTGGFPCQPYSMAGKRKGTEDDRHLWPSMLRAIREIQPTWILGENVSGLVNWNGGMVFDEVQADLEAEGYEVTPFLLPACGVNAPHKRERVWFVAHSKSSREYRVNGNDTKQKGKNGLRNDEFNSGSIGSTPDPGSINSSIPIQQRGQIPSENINLNREDASGITPDPPITGREEREQDNGRTYPKKNGSGMDNRPERLSDFGIIADTSDTGLQGGKLDGTPDEEGQERGQQPPGPATKLHQITDWSNFPTVSPVHFGDDGLSGRLSGITFPKWRNEGIKAMGNAIVPQVALQIFKSIQEYENTIR
jgi:DNA (cytosine-5)-methyltransferase 1